MLRITACYATGHGFAFSPRALDAWEGETITAEFAELHDATGGWVRAYTINLSEMPTEDAAEELFRLTNTTSDWKDSADFHGQAPSHLNARSLSCGDVLQITDTATGQYTVLGVDACGFRPMI